jgi:NDP-sugar pyrophosphorylase family protein
VKSLEASIFFDLASYRHKKLFANTTFVWEALGRISEYMQKQPLKGLEGDISPNAHLFLRESIVVGQGTVIEAGAYIQGPCIIGKNCTIRHGAYLRGGVITGDNCVIGHDSEVKNSIFLDDANAAHFAYVGDCIIGNRCNLGAGTKCANLRFDGANVRIHHDGKIIDSSRRKFGLIIGDDAQTGCNAVSNPGTLMGKGAFSYPCTHFSGVIPAGSLVRNEEKARVYLKENVN